MLAASPLYGRFDLDENISINVIIDRLKRVSNVFLNEAPFSAYLITNQGDKRYGMDYEEMVSLYPHYKKNLKTFSTSATSTGFTQNRVVRLHLRYDHPSAFVKGQYIISSGNRWRNQAIEKMLMGTWTEEMMKQAPEETESIRLQNPKKEENLDPMQPHWELFETTSTKHKPIIRMVDTFYFDKKVSVYTLLNLLDELSINYLSDTAFHAQLDTTDGDFHFNIDSQELRYMFTRRRHTLLTLYLDAVPVHGQWLSLMLSFHPLATGPNAEVEIAATQGEGITSLIWKTLAVDASVNQVAELNESFGFNPSYVKLEKIITSINYISNNFLHQIPPVVFLATNNGKSYSGLSFYQLRKIFRRHLNEIEMLSVGVNRIMTGQNMSLTFKFDSQGLARASLSLLWGDEHLHQTIKDQLVEQLKMRSIKSGEGPGTFQFEPQKEVDSEQKTPQTDCLIVLPLEADWSERLWQVLSRGLNEKGIRSQRAESLYESHDRELVVKHLELVSVIVADITHQHPDVFYTIGMARTMGKEIIIIAQQMRDIPADLRQFRCVIYHLSSISSGNLTSQIARLIDE